MLKILPGIKLTYPANNHKIPIEEGSISDGEVGENRK